MRQRRGRVSCVVWGVLWALCAGCVEETEEEARARCGRLPYECAQRACIIEAGFGHGDIMTADYKGPMVSPTPLTFKAGEREAVSLLAHSGIDPMQVDRLEVSADWLTVEHEGDAPPFMLRRTEPPRRVVVRRADGVSRGRSATLRWVMRGMCDRTWVAMEVKVWEARP